MSSLHFLACFFIFIGKNEFHGWIVNNNLQNNSFFEIYVTSLYYQMTTLTTVGYGDISATNGFEIAYGIFNLIVGTCVYSWTLTFISNYIKKNNEKYADFEDKLKVLREIKIEYPNIGKGLYDRIKRYLNYNKFEHKYNLKFILESLPSSLQNNLIIEIYKPIIKNFQFFKSFENSDFFVKIVTSLKPILSMKEDILIQEGDIIEDIIFIKTGVLALEIIIDLNDPKKSVESHLEMTGMNCFKNISNKKFSFLMNLTTFNSNYHTEIGKQIFNNRYDHKKEIKIIDLRKNEHFGDILMILNEKSPLTVKVKSKKAELFFLQKTEATEISNRYSNIWKRIVNRSLHNMKQIKHLIRKKVFLFIESNNIEIDPELKERYTNKNKSTLSPYTTYIKKKNEKTGIFKTIIEEEESNIMKSQISEKNLEASTKEQTRNVQTEENADKKKLKINKSNNNLNNINNQKDKNLAINDNEINNGQNFIKNKSFNKDNKTCSENNTMNYILKNFNKNHSFKQDKKSMEISNDINEVNNMITLLDKKVIRSNKKNQINNFNINIYTPKVQIPLNQINIDNQNSNKYNKDENDDYNDSNNSDNFRRINNEISYDNDFILDIKDNEIMMDNSDENNNIIYSNIKFKEKKENKIKQNTNLSEYYNSHISKLFDSRKVEKIINRKNKREKTEIKTNDIASIKSVSSDKSKINLKKRDVKLKDISNKFNILDSSRSTSFTIKSSYDNINTISKFNYDKNYMLREKTKKFILQQISNGIAPDVPISQTSKDNSKLLNIRTSLKLNNKRLSRKKSASLSSIKSQPKDEDSNRNSFDNNIKISKSLKKVDTNEKNNENGLNYLKTFSTMRGRNTIKKRNFKRHQSAMEIDKTYYHKINRIRRNKSIYKKNIYNNKEEKNEKEVKDEKLSYTKLISKNIEKNQKNLNNPAEYYARFFNNILINKNKGNNLFPDEEIKKRKTFHRHSII